MKERLEITRSKYYTRTVWSGRIGTGLLAIAMVAAIAAPASAQEQPAGDLPPALMAATASLQLRVERYAPDGRPPVELRVWTRPDAGAQADRILAIAQVTLTMLDSWFGAYPHPRLTVVDAGWRSGLAGAAYPAVAATTTRWIAPERDRALERYLVAAIARQYWLDVEPAEGPWLQQGLALYSATRAIHETLEGRNVAALRYFNGFIPFPIRSLQLSPNPAEPRLRLRHFAEVEAPANAPWRAANAAATDEAQRATLALQTLERFLGWPALQQALAAYREGIRGGSAATLAAIVSAQRGSDLQWFFDEAFNPRRRFDYGIDSVTSSTSDDTQLPYRTDVRFRRFGDGVFAGAASRADGSSAPARSLPVLFRFADGSEAHEWWDGRAAEWRVTYDSPAPAVLVAVDPDQMLVLDAEPSNNTRALRPGFFTTGIRLACHWALWLQDAVLTYASLV